MTGPRWVGLTRNEDAQIEAEENLRDRPDEARHLPEGEPYDVADYFEAEYGPESRDW